MMSKIPRPLLLKLALCSVGVVVLGGLYWHFSPHSDSAEQSRLAKSAAVPVTAAKAGKRDVPLYLQGLGTVQAFNTVTIRSRVDGQLTQILFKEGQEVAAGAPLAQIDSRSYQAALDQALAQKAQDEAKLANARLDLQRYALLAEKNSVTRQLLDTTRALVDQLAAAVKGDQAAIENTRVSLDYTFIRSPIAGRVGIRQVDIGNMVHASDSGGIVVITQMHPISVLFTLPEDSLMRIIEAMAAGPLQVTVWSRDGSRQLDLGALDLVDNQIDQGTGTIRLKATLPNQAGLLWPGQFVNTKLQVELSRQVVAVPAAAVQRGPDGAFAFIVKADGSVEVRKLTLGDVSEGVAVIKDGIQDGETVVTEGQYRLQQGSRVAVTLKAE